MLNGQLLMGQLSIAQYLLADADWIRALVPIVAVLLYVAKYLWGNKKAEAPPVAKRPAVPRQPVGQRMPPGGAKEPQAGGGMPGRGDLIDRGAKAEARKPDSLSAEIDQFLKEAAQRKRGKPQRDSQQREIQQREAQQRETQQREAKQRDSQRRAPLVQPRRIAQREQPVDVTVIQSPGGRRVSTAATTNLESREFDARASHLTDDLKRADAEREQHFRTAFDHKLGSLTDTSTFSGKSDEDTAAGALASAAVLGKPGEIAQMLSDPSNLRKAIVLNEILQPPTHRWS